MRNPNQRTPQGHVWCTDLFFVAQRLRDGGRNVWRVPYYACEPVMLVNEVNAQQGEVAISSNGRAGVAAGFDRAIIDCVSGATVSMLKSDGRARAVHMNAAGDLMLTGSLDGKISLLRANEGAHCRQYAASAKNSGGKVTARALDMSIDASLLLLGSDVGGTEGTVRLYDTQRDIVLAEWAQPKSVWSVAMHPMGTMAAVGGFEMALRLCMLALFSIRSCAIARRLRKTESHPESLVASLCSVSQMTPKHSCC
eukprot:6701617-Prymnesium_polylepis.2